MLYTASLNWRVGFTCAPAYFLGCAPFGASSDADAAAHRVWPWALN